MQHIRIVVLLFLLLIPLSACSKSPEAARKELGQMNIDYTDDSFIKYVEREDKVVVELFLTAGMSPNSRNKDKIPVLSIAAFKGHNEIVKLLITKGADPNAKEDTVGFTALMFSTKYPDVVKTLVKKGADVNATPKNGKTALIMAVADRNKEVVKVLLDNSIWGRT